MKTLNIRHKDLQQFYYQLLLPYRSPKAIICCVAQSGKAKFSCLCGWMFVQTACGIKTGVYLMMCSCIHCSQGQKYLALLSVSKLDYTCVLTILYCECHNVMYGWMDSSIPVAQLENNRVSNSKVIPDFRGILHFRLSLCIYVFYALYSELEKHKY